MSKHELTLKIIATTPKAINRILIALASILTPAEAKAFQKQIKAELMRLEREKKP